MDEKGYGISKELLAAIFDTSEFKQFSRDSRQEIVNALQNEKFTTLLDLDCGSGKVLKQLYENFPEMKASGFDYSLDRLAGAKENLAGHDVDLKFGTATQLPYADESFDVVISTSTFHNYPEPEQVLAEVNRVLVPGGVFILCDTYLNATLRYVYTVSKPINAVDIRMYSEADIWRLLGGACFTGISWRQANKYTYVAKAYRQNVQIVN